MKPKEYVRKYKLGDPEAKFNHQALIADLAIDFQSLIEYHQGTGDWHLNKFEVCVKDIRAKFDGISRKARGKLTDKQWNYFFATVVAPIREEMFGDELRARKAERDQARAVRDAKRNFWRNHDRAVRERLFEDFFYARILAALAAEIAVPTDSFTALGLPDTAGKDEVKVAYRELAHKHHPDKGGNVTMFRQVTEAKNRCMAYLEGR